MSCALILWIILIDAVLLRCFGLYGSQDQKEGVTWSLGIWMWLRTVLYGLAAQTQSLWLVSLNQSQTVSLERRRVLISETKEKRSQRVYFPWVDKTCCSTKSCIDILYVSEIYTEHIYTFYVKILAHIFGSSIMAFTGLKSYGEVEVATRSILGVGQRLIIFFLRASVMTGVLKVWWLIVLWWFGFQGIIKSKLAISWEFI